MLILEGIINFLIGAVIKDQVRVVKVIGMLVNGIDDASITINSVVVTVIGIFINEERFRKANNDLRNLVEVFFVIEGSEVFENLHLVSLPPDLVLVVHLDDNELVLRGYSKVSLLSYVLLITKTVFRNLIEIAVHLVKVRRVVLRIRIEGIKGITVDLTVVVFIDLEVDSGVIVVVHIIVLSSVDVIKIVGYVVEEGSQRTVAIIIKMRMKV